MKRRFIISLSTARAGTKYLTRMMSCSPGLAVAHEPAPGFDRVLRASQKYRELAMDFVRRSKIPQIKAIQEAVISRTYFEASHMWLAGFLEYLPAMGIVPDYIWLERDYRKVALSMMRLSTVPGRTKKGLRYYLAPRDIENRVDIPKKRGWTDYQIVYWYVLETHERIAEAIKNLTEHGARGLRINRRSPGS